MAPTEYYVDPSIAANSGAGTIGDPYGDLQYALNTVTRDSSNGDRFNVKSGTDEVLAASLDLTTYGTPTEAGRLYIEGYTTSQGDGGQGGISGNGSLTMFAVATLDWIVLKSMHMHNTGSATIVNLDNNIMIIDCEFDNTIGDAIDVDQICLVRGNYIHNIGGRGVFSSSDCDISYNYFANGTNSFTDVVSPAAVNLINGNIFSLSGSTDAILISGSDDGCTIINNSILSSSGTGAGIRMSGSTAEDLIVEANIIEGFSGAGGVGITGGSIPLSSYSYNAFFNNTTNATGTNAIGLEADNESLGSTAFAKSGSDTFANRLTYFAPQDVGNVINGATNNFTKGAIQNISSGGGSSSSSFITLL